MCVFVCVCVCMYMHVCVCVCVSKLLLFIPVSDVCGCKYHCVQVYVWTSLVCVPVFEAHIYIYTTQLYISVCSVHMMETPVHTCIPAL